MAFNVESKGDISLADIRIIVDSLKPFDTGFLYSFGNRYNETPQYKRVIYDLVAVPYIQFLEEGTQRSKKHVGFISKKTVGNINHFSAGMPSHNLIKTQRERANLISQGVMQHIKTFGQAGGRYDKFIGIT